MSINANLINKTAGLVKISSGEGAPTKLKDFSPLQKQVTAASPKGVQMSDYNPTAKAANCPTINSTWQASDSLPPTPNLAACSCMVNASSCVPASGLKATAYGDIFDYICGKNASLCTDIEGNATTGKYGTYSMCASHDKLAIVLNAYYQNNGQSASACDFNGQAQTQTASKSSSSCASLVPSTSNNSSGSGGNESYAVVGAPLSKVFVGSVSMGMYMVVAILGAGFLTL